MKEAAFRLKFWSNVFRSNDGYKKLAIQMIYWQLIKVLTEYIC